MTRIHIATGLALRSDGCLLLVASRYANHPEPLWNLPGGRQQPGELLPETVAREVLEETGLTCAVGKLAYASESYDGDVHVLNATFLIAVEDADTLSPARSAVLSEPEASRRVRVTGDGQGDHVVDVAWVPVAEVAERIAVAVVREPLLAYLRGELPEGYAGFHEAGITIQWPSDSA